MISLLLFLLCVHPQEKEPPKTQDPKVQDRLDDQEERIKDLERRLAETEKRQAQTTSANPLTVLNPRLTVVGDFLWRIDDRKVFLDQPSILRVSLATEPFSASVVQTAEPSCLLSAHAPRGPPVG